MAGGFRVGQEKRGDAARAGGGGQMLGVALDADDEVEPGLGGGEPRSEEACALPIWPAASASGRKSEATPPAQAVVARCLALPWTPTTRSSLDSAAVSPQAAWRSGPCSPRSEERR